MHTAYNGGLGNRWASAEGAYGLGYFTRQDIPTHFDIAEGWTIFDMSMQSLLMSTDPNRIMWMSGSVNIPGSPTNLDGKGGMIIDNSNTPGEHLIHLDGKKGCINLVSHQAASLLGLIVFPLCGRRSPNTWRKPESHGRCSRT